MKFFPYIILAASFALPVALLSCSAGSSGGAPSSVIIRSSASSASLTLTLVQKSRTATITLTNSGSGTGQITDLVGTSAPYSIVYPASLPHSIAALGTTTLMIKFAPTAAGTFTEALAIHTSDPQNAIINLEVTGSAADLATESTTVGRMVAASQPVPIGDNKALIVTSGPDGILGNSDDIVVLFDSTGSFSTTTAIPVRGLSTPPTVLSSTRAMIVSSGADLTYTTADDEVVMIDISGASPTTTLIPIPGLAPGEGTRPSRKNGAMAHIIASGPDFAFGGTDDRIYTIDSTPAVPTTSFQTIANLSTSAASRPLEFLDIAASTRVLLCSPGSDGVFGGGDDEVVVFFGGGGGPSRNAAGILDPVKSQIVMLEGSDLGMLSAPGANGAFGDADDRVLVIKASQGTVYTASIPNILSMPARISDTRYVVATEGADATPDTADDTIAVIRDNTVIDSQITVGNLDTSLRSQPITAGDGAHFFAATTDGRVVYGSISSATLVSSTSVGGLLGDSSQPTARDSTGIFVSTVGPDSAALTADDRVIFVDFAESPVAVITKTVAGIASDLRSRPVIISSAHALVSTAGPTLTFNTADDAVVRLGPIP